MPSSSELSSDSGVSSADHVLGDMALGALDGAVLILLSRIPRNPSISMIDRQHIWTALGAGAVAGALTKPIKTAVSSITDNGAKGLEKGFEKAFGSKKAAKVLGSAVTFMLETANKGARAAAMGALQKTMAPSAFTGNARETALSNLGICLLTEGLFFAAEHRDHIIDSIGKHASNGAAYAGYGMGALAHSAAGAFQYLKGKIRSNTPNAHPAQVENIVHLGNENNPEHRENIGNRNELGNVMEAESIGDAGNIFDSESAVCSISRNRPQKSNFGTIKSKSEPANINQSIISKYNPKPSRTI